MKRRRVISTTGVLAAGLLLGGCHSPPARSPRASTGGAASLNASPPTRQRLAMKPPRSLVFDSPRLSEATQKPRAAPGAERSERLPWYADRNDVRAATSAGLRLPTLERTTTFTVDRQQSFDGRVFNSTHSTTYRFRTTEAVRR